MTNKNKKDKQQDIDDVLMSLDSLLSNAQDSQLDEPILNQLELDTAKPQIKSKKASVNNTNGTPESAEPANKTKPIKSKATAKSPQANLLDVNTKAKPEPAKQPELKQPSNLHKNKKYQTKKNKSNNYPLKKSLSFVPTQDTAMQLFGELPVLDDVVNIKTLKSLDLELDMPKIEPSSAKPKTLNEKILHCAQLLFSEQSITDEQWLDFSQQINLLIEDSVN